MTDRALPADPVAEQCVLGAMMLARTAIADVDEILTAGDYSRIVHQIIHEAIFALYGRGEPADAITVSNELARRGELVKVGGGPYLHTLIASVATAANAGYHAGIVREHAVRRRLIEAGTRIVQLGYTSNPDGAGGLQERAARALDSVGGGRDGSPLETSEELLLRVLKQLENPVDPGLTTGWRDVDDVLRLRPGTFTVIGARTGVGKSVASTGIAEHVGTDLKLPAIYFSLEMKADELMRRRIAARARIPLDRLMQHLLTIDDWDRINRVREEIADSHLVIDDEPLTGLSQVKAQIRRMVRQGSRPRLVVVDLMTLMKEPPGAESRRVAVDGLSRGLKLIAREFNTAVVAVVQVNRGPETRHDKRPMLSDFRESGQIESDADNVILLYREDYYERESSRAGEIDMIIAKNRNGPVCTVTGAFQAHYSRIADLAFA